MTILDTARRPWFTEYRRFSAIATIYLEEK